MQLYLISSKGPRVSNQDSAAIMYFNDGVVLCVADGVGGNNGGEIASKYAIECFFRALFESNATFSSALEFAHESLLKKSKNDNDLSGMATTFTAVYVTKNKAVGIHCGDSRAYIIREQGLKQLTTDHSEVAKLLRDGMITKEAAIDYPRKNVIYSALGSHKPLVIDEFEFDLKIKDRILLLTDGFHGVVSKKIFRDVSLSKKNLKDYCNTLEVILEEHGPKDNYSIVAVELD